MRQNLIKFRSKTPIGLELNGRRNYMKMSEKLESIKQDATRIQLFDGRMYGIIHFFLLPADRTATGS